MRPIHVAALAVVALALGSAFLFIRVLVDAGMEPLGVGAARTGVSFLVLVPVALWQRSRLPRNWRVWATLAAISVPNMTAPFILTPLGLELVSSGTGSIVGSSMPMLTAVLAAFMIADERLTPPRIAGLTMGFFGVVLLMSGGVGEESTSDAVLGVGYLIGAVAGYSMGAVFIRRWAQETTALALTFIQLFWATCLIAPLAFLTGAYGDTSMGWAEWGSLAGLTVSATSLAVLLFMWLIVEIGPVRTSVVTYLFPPIGVTLGWLLLDEPVGWNLLLSLGLIVAGVWLVQAAEFPRWVKRLPRNADHASENRAG